MPTIECLTFFVEPGGSMLDTKTPLKLNQGMIDAICYVISRGNYTSVACKLCKIEESTFYDWINIAKKQMEQDTEEGLYITLYKSVKRAEAEAETLLVNTVREAAVDGKNWLAGMTFLERRHPDRWGRRDRQTIDITEHKTVTITEIEVVKDYGQGQVVEGEARELLPPGTKEG